MAVASVDDRELIKAMSWFDGFVVALAESELLAHCFWADPSLSLGGWGATIVLDFFPPSSVLSTTTSTPRSRRCSRSLGRRRGLCARGVEALHVVRRPDRGRRLLARLVGRAVAQRRHRGLHAEARFFADSTFGSTTKDWGIVDFYSSPGDPDRSGRDHRDLGGQRVGGPARGLDRVRDRRAAALPALRPHRRPVPHGRLELGQPAQPDRLGQLQHGRDQGVRRRSSSTTAGDSSSPGCT